MTHRNARAPRWVLLGVVLALLATVAACGGDSTKETATKKTTTTLAEESTTTTAAEESTTTSSSVAAAATPTTAKKPVAVAPRQQTATVKVDLPSGASTNGADVDPKGVLHLITNFEGTAGIHLDTTKSSINTDKTWMELVYGTLLREQPDGTFAPWMAAGAELVDTTTVKIMLRPNIKFTDGSAFDATAVKTSLMRTRTQSSSQGVLAGMHTGFKALDDVQIIDPLTVVAKLNSPIAGEFIASLAHREGSVVSPKQIATAPDDIDRKGIGAGPYTVVKFDGQILSLRKNPDFFDAASWRIGGFDWTHNTGGAPAGVNGLLAGTVDYFSGVPTDSAEKIEGDKKFGTASGSTDYNYILLSMCQGKAPFDNLQVRQAFQVAVDRAQYNELVYGKRGSVAYGLQPESVAAFEPNNKNIVKYDPEKAKSLLASAGYKDGLTVDFYIIAGTGFERGVQVLQAQLEKVGVKLNVITVRDPITEMINPQKAGILMIPGSRTGIDKYGRLFSKGGQQAYCGIDRPDVMGPATQAASFLPTQPQSAAGYRQAESIIGQNAYVIPVVYFPTIVAWNIDRVGGIPKFGGALGAATVLWENLYIRK